MQDLIGNGANLQRNAALATQLHEQWVLWQRVAVANALGVKHDGIVEVVVRWSLALERLPRVEDEGDIQIEGGAGGSELQKFGDVVSDWVAAAFAADHIESCVG